MAVRRETLKDFLIRRERELIMQRDAIRGHLALAEAELANIRHAMTLSLPDMPRADGSGDSPQN